MMRLHSTSTLVLASLLGVPAVALRGQDGITSLAATLAATEKAIAEVVGLQGRLSSHDPAALDELLALTEAPVATSAERAKRIDELQRDIDHLTRTIASGSSSPVLGNGGLTAEQKRALMQIGPGASAPAPIGPAPDAASAAVALPAPPPLGASVERPGYSADDLGRARLLVRAGRAHEALLLMADLEPSSELRYWRARATQVAGDKERAFELFTELAAEETGDQFTKWASHDARLLSFELELDRREKAPTGAERTKSAPTPTADGGSAGQDGPRTDPRSGAAAATGTAKGEAKK